MVGVAPAAKIYAVKIFASDADGAPDDRILAAMDRVITIKKNFLKGMPSVPVSGTGTEDDPFVYDSLNIQVANMSLGGPTAAAGRDVEDLLTEEMQKVGIMLAVSAGNAGPALLTVGSPATGIGPISSARRQRSGARANFLGHVRYHVPAWPWTICPSQQHYPYRQLQLSWADR